jgi:hypothetical protein
MADRRKRFLETPALWRLLECFQNSSNHKADRVTEGPPDCGSRGVLSPNENSTPGGALIEPEDKVGTLSYNWSTIGVLYTELVYGNCGLLSLGR